MAAKGIELAEFNKQDERRQQAIALMFASNLTQEKIAHEIGVNPATLSKWKSEEGFRMAMNEYARVELHGLVAPALRALNDCLHAKSEMVRYNAATYVLDRAFSIDSDRDAPDGVTINITPPGGDGNAGD